MTSQSRHYNGPGIHRNTKPFRKVRCKSLWASRIYRACIDELYTTDSACTYVTNFSTRIHPKQHQRPRCSKSKYKGTNLDVTCQRPFAIPPRGATNEDLHVALPTRHHRLRRESKRSATLTTWLDPPTPSLTHSQSRPFHLSPTRHLPRSIPSPIPSHYRTEICLVPTPPSPAQRQRLRWTQMQRNFDQGVFICQEKQGQTQPRILRAQPPCCHLAAARAAQIA